MDLGIRGRRALVTAGGRGIGRAVSRTLACWTSATLGLR